MDAATPHGAQISIASDADAADLALLKAHWMRPHDAALVPDEAALRSFAPVLASWMRERGDQSLCVIARVHGQPVGMAWLAIYHRVPNIGDVERRSGDVQSVLVLPGFRGRGIGHAMMQVLVDEADRRGIRQLSVSTTPMARRTYEGVGFRGDPRLLERPIGGAGG
jgi:GNAT superfamily N-acetyltransferase